MSALASEPLEVVAPVLGPRRARRERLRLVSTPPRPHPNGRSMSRELLDMWDRALTAADTALAATMSMKVFTPEELRRVRSRLHEERRWLTGDWSSDRVAIDPVMIGRAASPGLATSNRLRPASAGVDLYWLPLGAGGHSVRLNGKIFEAVAARLERRAPRDLYHSALVVRTSEGRYVIEQAPVRPGRASERGVVAEGAVGARWAKHFRIFRYELRRWRNGVIPDVAEAVESPQRLTEDPVLARRLLDLVPFVPTPVWGRDELGAGEMWNSNSFVSWLLARSGLDAESIPVPRGGRAPGWQAGIVVARR